MRGKSKVSTTKLINELHKQGIQLWVEDERLRFRAPQGAMTPMLRDQLQASKEDLINFLREAQSAQRQQVIEPAPRNGAIPLSSGQQRLWVLEQIETERSPYNDVAALQLTGSLDVTLLETALLALVRRHEVLRTSFVLDENGHPTQHINEPRLDWSILDLRSVASAAQPVEIETLARAESQRRFDLTMGPLFRVRLLQLAEDSHVLLVIIHHLVGDGWSIGVILRELSVLYTATQQTGHSQLLDRSEPLPELPIQYADYAIWQQEQLAGEAMQRHLEYWRTQLAGAPALLQLPTDRPRPPQQTFLGRRFPVLIDATLTQQLQQLAKDLDATPFMVILAALNVLFARYSRQDDIVIGAPIANRQHAALESLVGFFVSTILLRADLRENPTFVALVEQIKQVTHDAYAHQDLPFEKIVEALQPERNLSHTPLFQVMFAYQNLPALRNLQMADLDLQPLDIDAGFSKFDLRLELFERGNELSGAIEYNSDIFDTATVERMMDHFQNLLRAIIANPNQPISTIPMLNAAERHQLVVDWNDTAVDYPHEISLHQLFETQVERTPDAIAVIDDLQSTKYEASHDESFVNQKSEIVTLLTYCELNNRANQLAHHLQSLGVGPETMVGICAERSLEMVVGLLGILKAGGAYVPLDPTYPQERLAFLIADAQVPVLLTQGHLQEGLPEHDAQVICLDSDWTAIAAHPTQNPQSGATGATLAYMIYTSGSTGKPKGAMIPHQAIVNRLLWMQDEYQLTAQDHILQKTPFSFDVSVWEFFWPLITGARLVMAQPGGHTDPAYLVETIQRQEITVMHFVPPMLQLFLEAERVENCSTLRTIICSGEALPVDLAQRFFAKLSAELHNLYGPTEAAVDVSYWACQPDSDLTSVPIGRPVANTQLYILDPQDEPVPVGVPGELHIGGIQVGRGYHNRQALTKDKFIPNPFGAGTLYKTGDLTRYLPDGAIEFLGRIDNQVKLRGFRIELGEIEAVLAEHPAVQAALLLVREDQPGQKRLVAYVTEMGQRGKGAELQSDQDALTSSAVDLVELRGFLQEKLPDHMIPAAFVVLDALPLTPNGKVDRRALPAPDASDLAVGTDYVPPRTAVEETLVALWQELLSVNRVGIHDNFFGLGGDSILSIQLIARAKQAGIELTPKQIFQHQTIAALADVAGTVRSVEAEQGVVTGAVPLTPIQQWYLNQAQPDPHHFNQSVLLTVPSDLDVASLERAVAALWRHHDGLRLQFVQEAGTWQQNNGGVEAEALLPIVTHFNLNTLDEETRPSFLRAKAEKIQASLNLATGPLIHVAYFDYGAEQSGRLLIVIHHLAVDGVSWRILLEDLESAYQQARQTQLKDQPIQLPLKTTSYQAWARWLADHGPTIVNDELIYWQQFAQTQLSQIASHLMLPVDHPKGLAENTVDSVDEVICSLSVAETEELLRNVPALYRTEINDILLTALAQSIGQWSGTHALYLHLEGHGRELLVDEANPQIPIDLSRTVGWFTSLFPVHLTLPNEPTWPNKSPQEHLGKAIQSVKEQLRQIPRRGVGYGILRYLAQDSTVVPAIEPDVSFNYLGQLDATFGGNGAPDGAGQLLLGTADEATGTPHGPRHQRPHLLDINGMVIEGALQLSWRYSRNVHDHATIEALSEQYIAALRELIAHCRTPNAGGFTPADFPAAQIDQAALDELLDRVTNSKGIPLQRIEEIYALSPIQEGLLYETLYAPDSGVYSTQLCLTLGPDLDVDAFQKAWQQIIERHAILRTAFFWEGLERPLQVVYKQGAYKQGAYKQVELPWQQLDWRNNSLTDELIEQRLDALMAAERQQGFQLDQAPLARAVLIQANETTAYFVWTHHHILMDGWSLPIVFQEFLTLYGAITQGNEGHLKTPRPYREYISWRQRQTYAEAEQYWCTALQGFTTPTSFGIEKRPELLATDEASVANLTPHHAEYQLVLAESVSTDLVVFAKQQRLTPSVLFQGAWALLLHRYSGQEDLIFGTTVAGRPLDLPEVDTMVGLFINTVPLRISVLPDAPLQPWLQTLQRQQIEQEEHTVAPLVDIQNWSDLPRGVPLFENIFIYENYPLDPTLQGQSTDLIQGIRTVDQTNYPLTVIVEPHAELRVRFLYDSSRYDAKVIEEMASHLQQLLVEMTRSAEQRIKELPTIQAARVVHEQTLAETEYEFAVVERALLASPSVANCHVMRRTMTTGDSAVVAYVIKNGAGAEETLLDLQHQLPSDLPDVLRPDHYVPVKNLPLTAAGMVDEEALAAIPVLDDTLIVEWEAQIASAGMQETGEFALVTQQATEVQIPYHLSDLFPTRDRAEIAAAEGVQSLSGPSTGSGLDKLTLAISDGGQLNSPVGAPQTLSEALLHTASRFPEKGITFVVANESRTFLSYAALVEEAKSILTGLSSAGLRAGDRVILQIESLRDYMPTLWGCILGGITPVTVAIAPVYDPQNAVVNKLYNTWQLLEHPPILASSHLQDALVDLSETMSMPDLTVIPAESLRHHPPSQQLHPSQPDEVVFLQLTSGSTGIPKCIQETHQGIIAHIQGSQQNNGYSSDNVSLNWLPMDHVVPILTCHFKDIYLGCEQVEVATAMILADPLKWLDLMEQYHVTHTWAPNFGFKLVTDALMNIPERSWDLSSIQFMMNAGEQVTEPVVRAFLELVAPFGVPAHAMQPAFGMAEVCTCMTYQNHFGEGIDVHHILKSSLGGRLQSIDSPLALFEHNERTVTSSQERIDVIDFVDLGPPMPGVQIRITDDQNQLVPEGIIGRFQIKGDVVTPGYLYNDEANAEAFVGDGWFNSGDLGFILNGRLTLTGREKEMIIVNGANFYCYEIEGLVNNVPGVTPTFSAACGIPDPESGTEGIAIFFVPEPDKSSTVLIQSIRAAVTQDLGIAPVYVIPVEKSAFPKTTSGKIQRTKLKNQLLDGHFQEILNQLDVDSQNTNTVPDWFYERRWQAREPSARHQRMGSGYRLLFVDNLGLGPQLCDDERNTIIVEIGSGFHQVGPTHYQLDPSQREEYQQLFHAIAAKEIQIDEIIHLWTYDQYSGDIATVDTLKMAQQQGVYSLIYLLQALKAIQGDKHSVDLWVVSSHAQAASPATPIAYEKTTLLGFMQTVAQEFPWLRSRHIDLAIEDESLGVDAYLLAHTRHLRREFALVTNDVEVAYRRGRRIVPMLEKVDLRKEKRASESIEPGGIYLVTGGLGGIGTVVCLWLLETYQAKLLIIGRTPLPVDGQADPSASPQLTERLARYQLLQRSGGEVRYAAVDICDLAGVQAALADVESAWSSSLAGVLHLAGEGNLEEHWAVADQRRIDSLSTETVDAFFQAKVYGTWTLHQLLKERPQAAFIGFSSVNSLFGGASFGAYAAANRFLDGYCHYRHHTSINFRGQLMDPVESVNTLMPSPEVALSRDIEQPPRTYCFNWSQWDNLGMSQHNPTYVQEAARDQGFMVIPQEQGIYSLVAVLQQNHPQLIVGLDGTTANIQRHRQNQPCNAQALTAYTSHANVSHTNRDELPALPLVDRFGTTVHCSWVEIDEMPRDHRGLIDRDALTQLSGTTQQQREQTLPRTEVEAVLVQICQEVLGVSQVGVHDNFFEMGGDSILMIQVISRARQAGIGITPKEIVQNPTIAQLADVVGAAQTLSAEQGVVTGPLPLTPIQHWYLSRQQPDPHHFNQYVLLKVSPTVDSMVLDEALRALVRHHDALRLRFTQEEGRWQQINGGLDVLDEGDISLLHEFDLSAYDRHTQQATLLKEAETLQASLRLDEGLLLCAGLFRYGQEHSAHLFLAIHHLAVDGVSWRILLEDLEIAYQQAQQKLPIQLPAKSTSFRAWAEWLANYGPQTVEDERIHWQQILDKPQQALPLDYPTGLTQNTVASVAEVTGFLTQEETEQLLRDVPAVYHTEINDILLTALLQVLCSWTGSDAITIDLEGHGREILTGGDGQIEFFDLSRTVGWFTSLFPIRLEWSHRQLGETIKSVKEQLRELPNRGVGYGILRYLDHETPLLPKQEPAVSFNYLGQFDTSLIQPPENQTGNQREQTRLLLDFARDAVGTPISPQQERPRLIDISGIVVNGEMQFIWAYSQHIHSQATMDRLAQEYVDALRAIIAHCLNSDAGGFTPSDFPEADLDQLELDALLAEFE